MIVLLSLLALFEIAVLLPKRLEKERQARRDAPAKLVPPSRRAPGEPPPRVITAFRVEDWRPKQPATPDPLAWKDDPADVYMGGYMAVREGERLANSGDRVAAREQYELAAKVFGMIHEREPEFETSMVEFRRRKIAEALAELEDVSGGAPQSDDRQR